MISLQYRLYKTPLFRLHKAEVRNLFRYRRSTGARYGGAGRGHQSVQEARQQRQRSPGSGRLRHQRAQQEHRQSHADFKLARNQRIYLSCIHTSHQS